MASSANISNCLQKLNLNHEDVLKDIKSNYECVFSWDIYEKTNKYRNVQTDILAKVTQKLELIFKNENEFDFNRMCLQLISCFEIFLNGEFSKALSNVDNLIQTLECNKKNMFFRPISDACLHVVQVTRAFMIAFSYGDVQQILKKVKQSSNFNRVEKAAICGIKSKVFIEYPPEGNIIALEFAEAARNYNDTEMLWICIWLKAKGRKRRFDRKSTPPLRDEIEAANKLGSCKNNPELLLSASNVYREAGFIYKLNFSPENIKESNKHYQLSIDLTNKIYEIAGNDLKLLYHCLIIYIDLPEHLLKTIKEDTLNDIVYKLSQVQNNRIDEILGKYFLKIKKDYIKAKMHLLKSSSNGSFSSSLQLLKVECHLKSADHFPVVKYLNSLYEKFNNCPKRRLIIVSQILLYYVYNEENPKQLLYYLNVYLNEDIDYIQKKQHINLTFPLYKLKNKFKANSFLNVLTEKIKELKVYPYWDSENKKTLENIISKFAATCNPKRTEENIEIDLTCVVCLEIDAACVILKPCGHQCICKTCWQQIENRLCPLCRKVVTSTLMYKM